MWVSSELYPENPIWFTNSPKTSEIRYKLTSVDTKSFKVSNIDAQIFTVNPDKHYQPMLGIGTSFEETSVYAILKNKTDVQAKEILRALIDPQNGIGMNLFRITIGTSDFSDARAVSDHPQGFYSYQHNPDEPFSIQNDIDLGIIKVLNMAQDVAAACDPPQEIKFFASQWSPPTWMKTSENLIGGSLKKGYEKELAVYFRRFIQAYKDQGIPIYAMTLQNEANFTPIAYPGMKLTWQQERDVVIAAYEEFQREPQIATKLWIIDHNFEYWKKADKILDALARMGKKHYVDAVAFHDYSAASPSNMLKLQQRHPDINLQFSEMSKFGVAGMYDIQHYFLNGAQSYVYWVTMSTQTPNEHNQGPYNAIGRLSPTMLIQKDGDSPEWIINADYYLLGQFSRFIRPGAIRIDCDFGTPTSLTAVAFQNPDASIAAVLVNQTNEEQPFQISLHEKFYGASVPEKAVATVVFQ
jgi:O-glycosyl hydrolase